MTNVNVETDNLVRAFSPQPASAITFDVTAFVDSLVLSNQAYAGFSVRIADDLSPRNVRRSMALFAKARRLARTQT